MPRGKREEVAPRLRSDAMLFVGDEVGVFEPVLEFPGGATAFALPAGNGARSLFDQPVVRVFSAGGDFVNRGFHFMCLLLVAGAFPWPLPVLT